MTEGQEIKRGLFLCFIMLLASFVFAWVNTVEAKENEMVTAGLYKIEGDKRTLIKEKHGITESDCISRSREIAGFPFEGGHLEVVCKRTKTFKKKSEVSWP
jgi:hypothetical protein